MNDNMLYKIAEILGNGYKCYAKTTTGEVFSVEGITAEQRGSADIKEFVPLEGPAFFKIMKNYCSQLDDFEKQSELMETLLYDQPFLNFKRKTYSLNLADDWIAYRTNAIVDLLSD